MCIRSAKSKYWKKPNQSKRGLIPRKRIQRGLRKNYRDYFALNCSYFCSQLLVTNHESILHYDNIQKQKLQNLIKILLNFDSYDTDSVLFNFFSFKLTDEKQKVLCKGLNFSEKARLIEQSESLLAFELSFCNIE